MTDHQRMNWLIKKHAHIRNHTHGGVACDWGYGKISWANSLRVAIDHAMEDDGQGERKPKTHYQVSLGSELGRPSRAFACGAPWWPCRGTVNWKEVTCKNCKRTKEDA